MARVFFQVVMDKVLVHRGHTTLDVIALGFAVVVIFEVTLTALRSYVFAHTTTLYFGAKLVIEGQLSVGQLIAFNMLAGQVAQPVMRLAQLWTDFQQTGISVQRLGDILNTRTEVAGTRSALPPLASPVDGTVQQLSVHTEGGVVTEAQPLMVIVPSDNPLEVEAFFENKDIGFVKAGQEAEVKIETFQYTKYGTIDAEVSSVSHDAINDEKRGLIYSSRVRMARTRLMVDGTEVGLSPGMAVTVEVKTGQRRVIEYFLAPLLQHTSESLRER